MSELLKEVGQVVEGNLGAIAAGGAGLLVGTGVGIATGIAISNRKSTKSKKRKGKSRKKSNRRKTRQRYTPHTAGKGRDRSTKRIRYTKAGQPYVILRSGKARFITKRGAKLSRKRKGGRY